MLTRETINFSWLVTLRWGAIAGQAAIIVLVDRLAGIDLPLAGLAAILAVALASNVACARWLRRGGAVRESLIDAVMLLDVLLLTALLYLTGGPLNPFSFLYLVNIALAAVVLRPARTWTLAAFSLACFAALFVDHRPLPLAAGHAGHEAHMWIHLQGMWVAFGVAAGFIVYFIQRVTRALAARDAELAGERARRAREERLAALATLAAGAAHELATPLSTIAVVARELERQLAESGPAASAEDARLIRGQVERCRDILDQLAADAGGSTGEMAETVPVEALVESALAGIDARARVRVTIDGTGTPPALHVPPRAVARALRAVVRNACEASPAARDVRVAVAAEGGEVRIAVRDDGPGMAPEILARADEPFFTTKNGTPTSGGVGMGLGLFLTRAVLEHLGGRLAIASAPGAGTTVTLTLPRAADPAPRPAEAS